MATKVKKKKDQDPIALDQQLTKAEAFFEKNGKLFIGLVLAIIVISVCFWLFRS